MKRRYFLRHPPDCSGAKKSIKQGDYWLNRVVGIQQGGRNPTGGVRGAGRSYNDDVIQVNKHRQTLSTGAGRFFTFQIDKHFSRNFFLYSRNFGEKNEQGGFHFTFRSKFGLNGQHLGGSKIWAESCSGKWNIGGKSIQHTLPVFPRLPNPFWTPESGGRNSNVSPTRLFASKQQCGSACNKTMNQYNGSCTIQVLSKTQ